MWGPEARQFKILILGGLTALTLAIHYGWVIEPLFGHVHWFHALHGRFCYIPIVVAASWFGLRGGLYQATVISLLVLPFIFGQVSDGQEYVSEIVELVFYYFIAILSGALVDREFMARRKQQQAELQVERSHKLSLAGQIAAGVAHEIKNPLASIKGAADIITDDNTSVAEKQEFKGILQDEIRRIDGTVAEFLSFARPKETEFKRVDFSHIVRACIKQMATQSKQAGTVVESDIQGDIIVNGDTEKLHQAVLNLILNAIQASPPGTTITVNLCKEQGSLAKLLVTDTGPGIDSSEIEHVFEPFYTTRSSGTGLGLAVVKSIINNHGGEVTLQSGVGRGTTATVTLPLLKPGAGA